jgi:acetyl-CoA decarbonylase/synthase complex subunit delta
LAFEIPTVKYSGKIREVVLGADQTLTVGGETSYPFFTFEGEMPHKPIIAMEVWDKDPSGDWPEAVSAPFEGVLGDPGAWAKKCVEEFGADMIAVQLKSTDPNADDQGADHAVAAVGKVLDAVNVPVAVYGVANKDKDIETLSAVAEKFQGKNLVLGPVEDHNHKQIGAQALAYGHVVAANSPIDVNLAKQLNILLANLGMGMDKVLIDPTTGGLGYGMEYCYSVMERMRMAALVQEDDNLQQPIVNNMGQEVWKCKEAGESLDAEPTLGHQDDRGILMEVTQAVSLLLAGADVLMIRHPESVKLVKAFINGMLEGGAVQTEGLKDVQYVDPAKLPAVEFTPSGPPKKEEKKAAPAKPAAEAKPAEAKPAAQPEEAAQPKVEPKPAEKKEPEPKPAEPAKEAQDEAAMKAEAKAEAEAKAKAEAEAKAKAEAEAEAKKKAEAEAKAKAEAEAKKKAEEEAKAAEEAKKKEEEDLMALRAKRAKEREEIEAKRLAAEAEGEERKMKKADKKVEPEMEVAESIVSHLNRVHMRTPKY